jgi:hypothetical protein
MNATRKWTKGRPESETDRDSAGKKVDEKRRWRMKIEGVNGAEKPIHRHIKTQP